MSPWGSLAVEKASRLTEPTPGCSSSTVISAVGMTWSVGLTELSQTELTRNRCSGHTPLQSACLIDGKVFSIKAIEILLPLLPRPSGALSVCLIWP